MTTSITSGKSFDNGLLIVSGINGSGKTLIASFLSYFKKNSTYEMCEDLEWACSLLQTENLSDAGFNALSRKIVDLKIYNDMMARKKNFRISDLTCPSSFGRLFEYLWRVTSSVSDKKVLSRKSTNNLNCILLGNYMLPCSKYLDSSFDNRPYLFVEVARDPIYIFYQLFTMLSDLVDINNPRYFTLGGYLCSQYVPLIPSYLHQYLDFSQKKFNHIESLALSIISCSLNKWIEIRQSNNPKLLLIQFEKFATDPLLYAKDLSFFLPTKIDSSSFRNAMKCENIPRIHPLDSPSKGIFALNGSYPLRGKNHVASEIRSNYIEKLRSSFSDSLLNEVLSMSDTYSVYFNRF